MLEEFWKSDNVDVIFLNFAKAFDEVDHGILLNKLKKSELMVKSVCESVDTQFSIKHDNVLQSMIMSYSHSRKPDLSITHSSPLSTWLSTLLFFFLPR